MNHGEVGGLVAQSWGLPEPIVRGIAYHHHPDRADDSVCAAVAIANSIANLVEQHDEDDASQWHEQHGDQPWARGRLGLAPEQCAELTATIEGRFAEISAKYN